MTKYTKDLSKRQFIQYRNKSTSSLFKTKTCHSRCKEFMIYRCIYKCSNISPKTANPSPLRPPERKNSFFSALEPSWDLLTLTNDEIYRILHNINNNRFLGNKFDHQSKNKINLNCLPSNLLNTLPLVIYSTTAC